MDAMKRWSLVLLAVASSAGAQTLTRQNLAGILGFENGQPGAFPAGWTGSPGVQVIFGFLVSGTGKGWVDDLELLVDGVPAAQAPAIPTVLHRRPVWGFLKSSLGLGIVSHPSASAASRRYRQREPSHLHLDRKPRSRCPLRPLRQTIYATLKLPDAGYQLLGLFRFWNMVRDFYPSAGADPDLQSRRNITPSVSCSPG
jgi:hypothetical protein